MSMRYECLRVPNAALLLATFILPPSFCQDTEKNRKRDDSDEEVYNVEKGITLPA